MDRSSGGMLACTLRSFDDAVCLALAGRIDVNNALVLKAHLRMAAKSQPNTIIVDLTDLRDIDSSGVDALLDGQRTLARGGRMIVLAAPSPSIRKALGVLRLGEIMPMFPSVEEALTYLRAASDSEERPLAGS
jgi:anti-sigma B factor antagonist